MSEETTLRACWRARALGPDLIPHQQEERAWKKLILHEMLPALPDFQVLLEKLQINCFVLAQ